MKTWLATVWKGNLTIVSLVCLLGCLAAKKYAGLAVPDEVMLALGGAVILGLRRALSRVEAVINEQIPPTGPKP